MKVLVIGASGMLGSAMMRVLSDTGGLDVYGTVRDARVRRFFSEPVGARLTADVDVEHPDQLIHVLEERRPDVVINCAGLTKHKPESEDPLRSVPINTLMPHRLAALTRLAGARMIHVSSDCVFSGAAGGYVEKDLPDARDVYGKSKALGEVAGPGAVTLRTSTIGHELETQRGLLEWFLAQEGRCKGFTRAIFSGLPTVVFAQIVRDVVIPRRELSGLYHVAAKPITKADLLRLIADVYGKSIEIVPDDTFVIDRSLDATRFQQATGYVAPEWPELIATMHAYQ